MDEVALAQVPKVELHCHLDACVRLETAAELARVGGIRLPGSVREALVAPEACTDLGDFLRRIELAVDLLQRPEHLTRVARELVEDMALDGVIHGEIRFAPQLHTRLGAGMPEVLAAVDRGLEQGRAVTGISTALIVCCLRHQTPEQSLDVARLAAANRERVAGLDLAGDEGRYPDPRPHAPAFALARDAGLRLTAHAGENGGAQSIRDALDVLGAERIGHGVRIEEDAELTDRVIEAGISLDMCPRSNVQTRAVSSLSNHPIDRLLRRGARVTVSTDGRTPSATTVTLELQRLQAEFGWDVTEVRLCERNAAQAAFVDDARRRELLARISAELG